MNPEAPVTSVVGLLLASGIKAPREESALAARCESISAGVSPRYDVASRMTDS